MDGVLAARLQHGAPVADRLGTLLDGGVFSSSHVVGKEQFHRV